MTALDLRNLLSAAVLITVSGCMATSDDIARNADAEAPNVEPTRIALRTGTSAEPGEIAGYNENGVGVYLSANGQAAELTVYVIAPAEMVSFERPALRLTTMLDGSETTDVSEFEDVTLQAGESRLFTAETRGTLMDVVAEIDSRVLPYLE